MLGCIADDFTGATDLASVLQQRGFRVRIEIGADASPSSPLEVDAVVVALKTRTAPVADAVAESVAAYRGLKRRGADRIYLKYCSTFDSTPAGNIGPVADALLEQEDAAITIVVPSYPDNGRTVVNGELRVHGVPLAESAMRHHPLTPMTESDVATLLAPQTAHDVAVVRLDVVRTGVSRLARTLQSIAARGTRALVVIDAETNGDLAIIAEAASGLPVVTGAAGLALGMRPSAAGATGAGAPGAGATGVVGASGAEPDASAGAFAVHRGARLILCGSASESTMGQVNHARRELASRRLQPSALLEDADAHVTELERWALEQWSAAPDVPVMIYSAAAPEDVVGGAGAVRVAAAERIERALGALATRLTASGARQLILAGGETCGRAVGDLGLTSLDLGPEIAPGVAWCSGTTSSGLGLTLALKSGNFGRQNMFTVAWEGIS